MIAGGRGIPAFAVLLLGCPRSTDPIPPDDGGGATSTATEPIPERPACGGVATVFADPARTLPHAATMLAILALADATLADALAQVSNHARAPDTAIPVRSAFSIAQWSWEVPLVQSVLERAGFRAGELAAVHLEDVPPLWILPLGCGMAEAIAALERDERLAVRDLGDAALATPVAGSDFAFDVIVREDAIALVIAGKGRAALAAWRAPAPDTGLPAPSAGSVVATIAAAPIRMLVRPKGLVAPDAASTSATARHYRVTATGVIALDDA